MDNKLIIIVDDEPSVVKIVTQFLKRKGYRTKGFFNAPDLFKYLSDNENPDLIILDLMMPDMDGFEVCKKLKEKDRFSAIPVIILSGKGQEIDKIFGLDMGADDYIVKPFSPDELNARIRAVLRRVHPELDENKITIGGIIEMDLNRYIVTVDEKNIELTNAEFKILELLASRKGQVFTRDRILDFLWGEEKIVVKRTIDVHIRHLREKLGEAGEIIKNVRGVGYKIEE